MFRFLLMFPQTTPVDHLLEGIGPEGMEVEMVRTDSFTEGMDLSDVSPFDMVIADWEIDGVMSIDVVEAFKKGGETRFVIITDQRYKEMSSVAMRRGCDDIIWRNGDSVDARHEVSVINHLSNRMVMSRDGILVEHFLIDNPLEGIVVVNGEGALLYVNMLAVSMFGLKPDQESIDLVKGMSALEFIHPDDRETALFRNASMLDEYGYHRQEFRGLTVDGGEKVIEEYATRIRYNGQQAVLIILRDVTEFHKRGKDLELAWDRLDILNRITRHDMVNKLTAAMGYLELMHLKDSLDPVGISLARKLNICLNDIQDMIGFIQDYQEAGHYNPVWSSVLLLEAQALKQAALHDVVMDADLMDVLVFTDPMLEKVLGNLIDNSIRHGGGVSHIRLWDAYDGSDYLIVVEDDGKGIPEDDKTMIFEKGVGFHTGYGLFLVRSILQLTGITISENGIQGEGARFEIRVPDGRHMPA